MSDTAAKKPDAAIWDEVTLARARRVREWLDHPRQKAAGMTQTALARAAGMNTATLNGVVSGTYPSSPLRWLTRLEEAIVRLKERDVQNLRIPFVETSIWKVINAACTRAQHYSSGTAVSAFVGTGKTECLSEYQARHEQVYIVQATPTMTADVLLNRLVDATGADVVRTNPQSYTRGTKDQRATAIIEKLRGSQALLVIDEADKTTLSALEYVRRITDLANIGFVLAGTEQLNAMVRHPEGRFGQISSRITFWPKVMRGITEQDCRLLVEAALGKDLDEEITEDVHAAFWECCEGSGRVLVRGLIPGARDYILRKKEELTGRAIHRITREVLGFDGRSRTQFARRAGRASEPHSTTLIAAAGGDS